MQIITIPNLEIYQHYKKDRKPIWIKLYVEILYDQKIQLLKDNERWIYVSLLLLASRHNNEIPADFDYIARNCSQKKRGIAGTILKLRDLKLITIKRIAKCYQNAFLEESREDKIRVDKNGLNKFNKLKTKYPFKKITNNKGRTEIAEEVAKRERSGL